MSRKNNQPETQNLETTTTQELPKTPTQLKREELESLSDSQLDERYLATFQTKGPEMSREQVIDAIMANSPNPGAPTIAPETIQEQSLRLDDVKEKKFISKETGKEYAVSGDTKGRVVVRQVNIDMLNGSMVEVPNTETVQVYYKDQYDKLVESNFFSDSKLKVEVLQGA